MKALLKKISAWHHAPPHLSLAPNARPFGAWKQLSRRMDGLQFSAGQIVTLAGLALITAGTLLLMTPWAIAPGKSLRILDALFTATSAVCLTGLIVTDTATEFTMFGQMVILALIQIGGLGYAILATLLLLAVGHRIGLHKRMMLAEALNTLDFAGLIRFVKTILAITFSFEAVGAILLTWRFAHDRPVSQALFDGIFHSVSAFNNAGFSTFSLNLIEYQQDWGVNLTIGLLVFFGGIGFIVFRDVVDRVVGKRRMLQPHTKLALSVSGILLVVGMVGIFLLESHNPQTIGSQSYEELLMVSAFHSISARTAGFNSVDLSHFLPSTLYMLILLMMVGGSPGGMAGGLKTTTLGVVWLAVWGILRKKSELHFFYRRMPPFLVLRAMALTLLAIGTVTSLTFILVYTERLPFLAIMFEVASALGTVGLSVGDGGILSLSTKFTDTGKIIILLCMILGRYGTLLFGLGSLLPPQAPRFRYAEGKVAIG